MSLYATPHSHCAPRVSTPLDLSPFLTQTVRLNGRRSPADSVGRGMGTNWRIALHSRQAYREFARECFCGRWADTFRSAGVRLAFSEAAPLIPLRRPTGRMTCEMIAWSGSPVASLASMVRFTTEAANWLIPEIPYACARAQPSSYSPSPIVRSFARCRRSTMETSGRPLRLSSSDSNWTKRTAFGSPRSTFIGRFRHSASACGYVSPLPLCRSPWGRLRRPQPGREVVPGAAVAIPKRCQGAVGRRDEESDEVRTNSAVDPRTFALWFAAIATAAMGIYPPWTQDYAAPTEMQKIEREIEKAARQPLRPGYGNWRQGDGRRQTHRSGLRKRPEEGAHRPARDSESRPVLLDILGQGESLPQYRRR